MIRYVCSKCGHILYVKDKTPSPLGVLSPYEVVVTYKFKCPRCGKQLVVLSVSDWKERIRVLPCPRA